MFDGFFSSIFEPMIDTIGVLGFVIAISFVISLIILLIQKYTTNQNVMKGLRDDIARLQKELKEHMNSKNQVKAMKVQKEMMDKNMQTLSYTMKASLITMLPILLLFGWLSSNLAFIPLNEDVQFTVNATFDDYKGNAELIVPKGITVIDNATKVVSEELSWRLSGKIGEYLLEWKVGDKSYTKNVIITDKQKYAEQMESINDGIVKQIKINYKKQIVLDLFGWKLGWFGTYILLVLLFSAILKKLLKVY